MTELTEPLPWRADARAHFPGLPAWAAPTAGGPPALSAISLLPEVTTDWAWGGARGAGIRVSVLDSGIDGSHPAVGRLDRSVTVSAGPDGEAIVTDAPAIDGIGHGTACAGVIRSIAPEVELTSVRVLTDGMSGSGAALLAGLAWSIDQGFDVINLSLSTTRPQYAPALYALADRAYFRRCTLVVSAHNMPVQSFPWTFASVISVACHDEAQAMTFYYNPAPPVEFYARGVKVPVPWTQGRTRFGTGNSFAAPHIAAVCALILSKHRWLTPFQLKTVLYLTAKNVRPDGGSHVGR
jgi:subtilisin family serine protease